jgi:hypothetical protein
MIQAAIKGFFTIDQPLRSENVLTPSVVEGFSAAIGRSRSGSFTLRCELYHS